LTAETIFECYLPTQCACTRLEYHLHAYAIVPISCKLSDRTDFT